MDRKDQNRNDRQIRPAGGQNGQNAQSRRQPGNARSGGQSQTGNIRAGATGEFGNIRSGGQAQPVNARSGGQTQPGNIRSGATGEFGNIRSGGQAQPVNARSGGQTQPVNARSGGQAGNIRSGGQPQPTNIRSGDPAQALNFRSGSTGEFYNAESSRAARQNSSGGQFDAADSSNPRASRASGGRQTSYRPKNIVSDPYRRMNETFDGYPPVRHRSRKQSRRAAVLAVLSVIIAVMLLVSVVIFAVRCASGEIGGGGEFTSGESVGVSESVSDSGTLPMTDDVSETSPPETSAPDSDYDMKTMSQADMHKGYLILVNYQNAYSFDTDFKMKTIYGNKNLCYKVRDTLVQVESTVLDQLNAMMEAFEKDTGKHDILVNSTIRTKEEQEEIYQSRVDEYGEDYAAEYVSLPGYSEHHTGLALDLTVYDDNNQAHSFDEATSYPEWLNSNGQKWGFIQRYKADKIDITKISYESWHYRYVGKPHAFYMNKNSLCLEEYIDALRGFTFDGKHLQITDDEGANWEIYFVKASSDGDTEVPVPKNYPYTVSGNNVDGFIVTVQK